MAVQTTSQELFDRLQIVKSDPMQSQENKDHLDFIIAGLQVMAEKLGLNSRNSSKPPSSDENKLNKNNRNPSGKPRGGQQGHCGSTLEQTDSPDIVTDLKIDTSELDEGKTYHDHGHIKRQVIDIKISKVITEYRAQRVIDGEGNVYTAGFPKGVSQPIQYGATVKAHVTYMSVYQLTPYQRLAEQFGNEYLIPISSGSISNFISEASVILTDIGFDEMVKNNLMIATSAHADETSINISGEKRWLHGLTNSMWAWLEPHDKRGSKAIEDIGIIPDFGGILHHDHWKPYYKYSCQHALCNAHHKRELIRANELDGQAWALEMKDFLKALNLEVQASTTGMLERNTQETRRAKYQSILLNADIECPAPPEDVNSKRRVKRTKSRNLLERLRKFEDDVLRFMTCPEVSFTNNMGEQDLRMSKVRQKISGCFVSLDSAKKFYRVRSYLLTCQKQGISATEALQLLFGYKLPWPKE